MLRLGLRLLDVVEVEDGNSLNVRSVTISSVPPRGYTTAGGDAVFVPVLFVVPDPEPEPCFLWGASNVAYDELICTS